MIALGNNGNKILLNLIKAPATEDVSKRLLHAIPNGSFSEKYRIKPRINPPSANPNKAPAKRLKTFKIEKSKTLLRPRNIKKIIACAIKKIRRKDKILDKMKLSFKRGKIFKAKNSYQREAITKDKTKATIPLIVLIRPCQSPNQTKPNRISNKIKSNKPIYVN